MNPFAQGKRERIQLQREAAILTKKVVKELYGQKASRKALSDLAKKVANAVAPAIPRRR